MKVLIVDGSKERRRDLTMALADLTNIVIQGAVPDVRTAIAALTETPPDVVLTDVTLPDGDGTYLLDRMRSLQRAPAVIVLASRTSDEQRSHYLSAGADSYLDRHDFASVRAAVVGLAATRHALGTIPPTESQRLLGRMTAGVVHDFNNYLHVAQVGLDLVERNGFTLELLANTRAALDAMQRLNATLLTYARGGVPTTAPVDLGAVVRETLTLARRMIAPGIVVDVRITDNMRKVMGVRAELDQVVLNLVLNACDSMANGGRLEIVAKQCTAQAAMLEVSDTGTGIPPTGTLISSKPGRNGPGLGLTIVRTVVARMSGALRIVDRPGGGTTIAIMLPTPANGTPPNGTPNPNAPTSD
jgi:signal transduction histidine kinase